jgi:hypothetical protein
MKMDNQIYRIRMPDNKTLEFYICDTNEIEPYKKTKEMGIVFLGDNKQVDGGLNYDELSSLINFLENCKEYIGDYNNN